MYSQVVSHPSTDIANILLTSVIGRELVISDVYGRNWSSIKVILFDFHT